jgi:glycosyltransferase involved in cell wall biosynthesis
VADRTIWAGWSDDVRSHVRSFDVFVLPSRFEAFPLAVLEALLAEKKVVATVIPRQQPAATIEETGSWRRRYRFRNGLEGRISQLKRKGLRRTRLRSLEGAQTWSAASPSPTTCSGWRS